MRILVVAVGRLRPPFSDDVQHYQKLLARHVKLELIEVREDEQVARRIPDRTFVSLLDREGDELDMRALLSIIDVVKIEVLATPPDKLPELVRKARTAVRVKLLAEKVDTRAQADRCRDLGFDLFQGQFFLRATPGPTRAARRNVDT